MPTQAHTYALTSVDRVRRVRLGIQTENFDELFASLINAMSDYIEGQCNRRFKQTTYNDEVYAIHNAGEQFLILKNSPVALVFSFQYRMGTPSEPLWSDMYPDTWELLEDGKSGIIEVPGGLPKHVKVSYLAGYLIDWDNYYDENSHTLPSDISDLVERLVVREFKKRESEGKMNEGFDGAQIAWKDGLDDIDTAIIARHRHIPTLT